MSDNKTLYNVVLIAYCEDAAGPTVKVVKNFSIPSYIYDSRKLFLVTANLLKSTGRFMIYFYVVVKKLQSLHFFIYLNKLIICYLFFYVGSIGPELGDDQKPRGGQMS